MNSIFSFIKKIFTKHHFSIINKYNIGDICFWVAPVDCMYEPKVEITFWEKIYDRKNKTEKVFYNCVDLNNGKKYHHIDERELILYEMFTINKNIDDD